MKFLADVNIPQTVIQNLTKFGHDVLDIKKNNLKLKDIEVIKIAKQQGRIILTRDKDFIVLIQFPKYQVPTIAIRLTKQTPQHILEYLTELLHNQDENVLKNSLTIVKEDSADSYPYLTADHISERKKLFKGKSVVSLYKQAKKFNRK